MVKLRSWYTRIVALKSQRNKDESREFHAIGQEYGEL